MTADLPLPNLEPVDHNPFAPQTEPVDYDPWSMRSLMHAKPAPPRDMSNEPSIFSREFWYDPERAQRMMAHATVFRDTFNADPVEYIKDQISSLLRWPDPEKMRQDMLSGGGGLDLIAALKRGRIPERATPMPRSVHQELLSARKDLLAASGEGTDSQAFADASARLRAALDKAKQWEKDNNVDISKAMDAMDAKRHSSSSESRLPGGVWNDDRANKLLRQMYLKGASAEEIASTISGVTGQEVNANMVRLKLQRTNLSNPDKSYDFSKTDEGFFQKEFKPEQALPAPKRPTVGSYKQSDLKRIMELHEQGVSLYDIAQEVGGGQYSVRTAIIREKIRQATTPPKKPPARSIGDRSKDAALERKMGIKKPVETTATQQPDDSTFVFDPSKKRGFVR